MGTKELERKEGCAEATSVLYACKLNSMPSAVVFLYDILILVWIMSVFYDIGSLIRIDDFALTRREATFGRRGRKG